jgi:hypothetical protein
MQDNPHDIIAHSPAFKDLAPHKVALVVKAHLDGGDPTYALAYLAHATRRISESDPIDIDKTEFAVLPVSMPNLLWDTFFRAMYRHVITGRKPEWTHVTPLAEPTYIIERESNHLRADIGTPAHLRALNILIDEENLRLF